MICLSSNAEEIAVFNFLKSDYVNRYFFLKLCIKNERLQLYNLIHFQITSWYFPNQWIEKLCWLLLRRNTSRNANVSIYSFIFDYFSCQLLFYLLIFHLTDVAKVVLEKFNTNLMSKGMRQYERLSLVHSPFHFTEIDQTTTFELNQSNIIR